MTVEFTKPLKEITNIPYSITESLVPFALQSTENGYFCLTSRLSIELLQINYKATDDTYMRLINTSAEQQFTMPTKGIPCDAQRIYKSANHLEKKQLCLDAMLLPEMVQTPPNISLVSVKWSPLGAATKTDCYAALLNNFGGCKLQYRQQRDAQNWTIDISALLLSYCLSSRECEINTFDLLQSIVHNVHITAITWNNHLRKDSSSSFACFSASGKLCIFNVKPCQTPLIETSIEMVSELGLFKVNAMKWFTFTDSKRNLQSFLVAGDCEGNVILAKIEFDETENTFCNVQQKLKLWSESDKLRVSNISIECSDDLTKILVIICKGSHLLAFRVNIYNYKVEGPAIHDIGNLFISSLTKISSLNYVISSVGGTIEHLKIASDHYNNLKIEATEIKCSINFDNYCLYGMCVSPNQAFWLLATYPRQPFDHLILRQPVVVSICALPIKESLTKLLENPTLKLTNYGDCAELIRFCCLKNGDNLMDDNFLLHNPSGTDIDDEYIYNLKIRMIVYSARASFLRKRFRQNEATFFDEEAQLAKKTILSLSYCKQLSNLIEKTPKGLTAFQYLSGKCLLKYLLAYLEINQTEKQQIPMKELIVKRIKEVLQEAQKIFEKSMPEFCVYCNETIESVDMTCSDNHDMARCCLTMVQVPITNTRFCSQCNSVALDDIDSIKQEVELSSDDPIIWCPLCDLPMQTK